MSDIVGEAAAVRAAFDKPTLRLLDRKYAPVVLAVFATVFTRDVRSIPAGRLHTQVDVLIEELRAAGEELPTVLSGRQLCVKWMNEQWLYRTLNDAGDDCHSFMAD